jgi:hypothetical protein
MKILELIWHRGPYCGYFGIRLSSWWFLVLIKFTYGQQVDIRYMPPQDGKCLRFAGFTCKKAILPTRKTRQIALAFSKKNEV